jgi:putative PIN family toxin of toxin-antitoxin system
VKPVVVLDVNILGSAAVSELGSPRIVVRAGLRRQFRLIISTPILTKLRDTFQKRYFADRLTEEDQSAFIDLVTSKARAVQPEESVRGIAPDCEEDRVLGTAVAANADFLVTGDKGLLAIGEYMGVRIVTADVFLAELDVQ